MLETGVALVLAVVVVEAAGLKVSNLLGELLFETEGNLGGMGRLMLPTSSSSESVCGAGLLSFFLDTFSSIQSSCVYLGFGL